MDWRAMTREDLGAVMRIAGEVHPGLPEAEAVFAERLRLFPAGALILGLGGAAAGYAVVHPWAGPPPKLDTLLGALPAAPDALYLHDVALLPAARGQGAARRLIDQLDDVAWAQGLGQMALTAVSGSAPAWQRLGFAEGAPVAGYGAGAVSMVRSVPAQRPTRLSTSL